MIRHITKYHWDDPGDSTRIASIRYSCGQIQTIFDHHRREKSSIFSQQTNTQTNKQTIEMLGLRAIVKCNPTVAKCIIERFHLLSFLARNDIVMVNVALYCCLFFRKDPYTIEPQ